MKKLLESAGSSLSMPALNDERTGIKEVVFKTVMLDEVANTIGLYVVHDNGKSIDKVVDENEKYSFGNAVAEAMDVLANTEFPIGTKFKVKIEFTLPEE